MDMARRTGAVVVGSGGATVVVGTGAALVEGVPLAVAEVDGAVVDGVLLLGTTSVDGIDAALIETDLSVL